MPAREKDFYRIRSVEKALDVLEVLSEQAGEVGVSKISDQLGINKSAVYRLLATLEGRGYVERGRSKGQYRVGLTAYETGQKFLSHMELLNKAKPAIEDLSLQCGETIYLGVPCKDEVLLFNAVETRQLVQVMPMVGKRFPLLAFSGGRVIKAFQMDGTCPEAAFHEIQLSGVCIDTDSLSKGVTSISVPFFDSERAVAGCLCLVAPDFRMTEQKIEECVQHLVVAGHEVSVKLGFTDYYLNRNRFRPSSGAE